MVDRYARSEHPDATGYPTFWLWGDDQNLFQISRVDGDSNPKNGYEQILQTARPLPAGVYSPRYSWQSYIDVPCGYKSGFYVEFIVTTTAPSGTTHELFFDPVTVGSSVVADGTNGVLKPAAFTDANGGSATIHSVSYEASSTGSGQAGTVKVGVTPDGALGGQIVDFIELDGTVSLSLDVADAVVDAPTGSEPAPGSNRGQAGTLSWSVASQPWEGGDMLMVRIREARE